jgi:hypothetical protein
MDSDEPLPGGTGPVPRLRGSHDLPGQVGALLWLRWRMVRSPGQRTLLVALTAVPVLLVLAGVAGLQSLPPDQAFNILLVTPTVYLAFIGLSVLVPLVSGGGNELYPTDQVAAYPLRARTHFVSTLLLVPANLAWVVNVVSLFALTIVTAGPVSADTIPLVATVLAFVVMATVAGHAVGWTVVGIRQTRPGRIGTWAFAAAIALATAVVVRTGQAFPVLERSPTRSVLLAALDGYAGHWLSWARAVTVMALVTVTAAVLGIRCAAWALRRPGDHALLDASRSVRRRAPRPTLLRELVAVDRASVWRAPALRRGGLVLLLLPGLFALVSGLQWQSLVMLAGLVAAGGGLLFGINAFALDGSGAVWLTTLPGWHRSAFTSKVWVVTEITGATVLAAIVGGALRAPAPTAGSQLSATLGCGVAAGAVVVASALRSSVRRPHRAALLGPRDTPAPPGATIGYSVKLAGGCTVIGLLFTGVALAGPWWVPPLLVVPFVAWAGRSLVETRRLWDDPVTRARVVQTVTGG